MPLDASQKNALIVAISCLGVLIFLIGIFTDADFGITFIIALSFWMATGVFATLFDNTKGSGLSKKTKTQASN